MICPIMTDQFKAAGDYEECWEAECALWDKSRNCCGLIQCPSVYHMTMDAPTTQGEQ